MPYLRAALLRKKKQEQEEEILKPPVIPVEPENEPEIEEEESENPELISTLLNAIDQKVIEPAEPEEIIAEVHEQDITEPEAEPETPEPEPGNTQEISEPEPEITQELEEQELPSELPEPEQEPEIATEDVEAVTQPEHEEPEPEQENSETEPEPQVSQEQPESEETLQVEEEAVEAATTEEFDENSLIDSDNNSDVTTLEPEPEHEQDEIETEPTQDEEPEPDEFKLQYDFTSGERYVDKVSTKTDFDKMLDELGAISKDLLEWQVEKFANQYTGKFQGEGDKSEADAKKFEAFLGGYITNAAMILDDKGYRDQAIKQLEQAKSILEARKRLEEERQAIIARVEEQNDAVDLSDILGLFGDA